MKIYNLKNFAHGLFMLALGLLNLLFNLQTGLNWQDYILIGALLFMGGRLLLHSLSRTISREEQLDEMDERNQLVLLKNKSRAFSLLQYSCLILAAIFIVAGKLEEQTNIIFLGVGLIFAFAISMFTDILIFIDYENRL